MIVRDNRSETAVTFTVKGHLSMVEKGMCKVYGNYAHEDKNYYKLIGYPLVRVLVGEDEGPRRLDCR